jgi:hypothetical protein
MNPRHCLVQEPARIAAAAADAAGLRLGGEPNVGRCNATRRHDPKRPRIRERRPPTPLPAPATERLPREHYSNAAVQFGHWRTGATRATFARGPAQSRGLKRSRRLGMFVPRAGPWRCAAQKGRQRRPEGLPGGRCSRSAVPLSCGEPIRQAFMNERWRRSP